MKKIISQLGAGAVLLAFTSLIWNGVQSSFAGPITVFATPVVSSGTNGLCPGGYAGYVIYTKTAAQGWGWAPTNTVHTATDTNRTDTKVEFLGKLNDNSAAIRRQWPLCSRAQAPNTGSLIYFPNNNVPTNSYPIVLNGFNP